MSEADEASAYACLMPNGGGSTQRSASVVAATMTNPCSRPSLPKDYAFLFVGICIGIFLGQHVFSSTSNANADQTQTVGIDSGIEPPGFSSAVPPLSELVNGNHIRGDVSWMLNFSIVDYPKAGTTFLMNYLRRKNDEIYINNGEICYLNRRNPSKLVRMYYKPHLENAANDQGERIQFGIKCPEDLETEFGLQRYAKYFPDTKMIISVRHPILWFESYYNFRAYHRYPLQMPHTDDLIGPAEVDYPYVQWNCSKKCPSGNQNVFSQRANFHWSMSRLGKTKLSTDAEWDLLQHHKMSIEPSRSKIFLVENRQLLYDHPASQNFSADLRDFLALHSDLRPLKPWTPIPADEKYSNKLAAARRINICDDEHKRIRKVLVESGRNAAEWITNYFIESEDVVVTSRELFIELLKDWAYDPCEERHKRRLRVDAPE